jgi:hypothetical protein
MNAVAQSNTTHPTIEPLMITVDEWNSMAWQCLCGYSTAVDLRPAISGGDHRLIVAPLMIDP